MTRLQTHGRLPRDNMSPQFSADQFIETKPDSVSTMGSTSPAFYNPKHVWEKLSPIISQMLSQVYFLVRVRHDHMLHTFSLRPPTTLICRQPVPRLRLLAVRWCIISALLFIRLQASANHAASSMMNFVLPREHKTAFPHRR
jgi:hypothetical protein